MKLDTHEKINIMILTESINKNVPIKEYELKLKKVAEDIKRHIDNENIPLILRYNELLIEKNRLFDLTEAYIIGRESGAKSFDEVIEDYYDLIHHEDSKRHITIYTQLAMNNIETLLVENSDLIKKYTSLFKQIYCRNSYYIDKYILLGINEKRYKL